jgi:hypothetical protein
LECLGEDAEQQNVLRFRVDRLIPADAVPYLTTGSPELHGKLLIAVAFVDGPITNYTYTAEAISPHLDAIRDAISSQREYVVETDSTARDWPHTPDPRGRIEQRILRAIAEQRFLDDPTLRS